ncbi:SurA N-terminal domain-containing protein [Mesorhizobium sp. Z1-4]|uniref:SurA N-terminal domain-containing protein n=1 Tax=Mesorhizobium sp. Z1-4 TaxID=2448478 RepID=UPI000FDBBA47|nr:SurA N-terminal domain-containing protein [Mesorhizobium sp. Z1-4]
MLDSLRQAATTWVAKLLLGLLVLSFAVWGISGSIFGGPGNSVLTAGETSVSIVEYRLAYDRQLNVMSRQFGTRLTREQAAALGIDQQVLSQLVAGALLDEQASEMRLGLSEDRLAQLTAEDPAFHGPDGRFDRQQFEFVLRQVGMRPEDYLRNRERVAIRQQIVDAVAEGLRTPDAYLRAVALYQGEDRTVELMVMPRSIVEPIADPTDAQVTTYFDDNKQRYAAPEYRGIAYIKLEPEDIADEDAVLPDAVEARYNDDIDRYTTAETRRIEQLVFASEDDAKAALEKIRAGTSFEDIVAEQGRTMADVLLGTFAKNRVADPAIAEIAFGLPSGGVSDVVKGNFGSVLVRVTEIKPANVQPLAEVAGKIRTEIALEEAANVLLDVHDSYEDARAGGETMQEVASRLRLTVETVEAVDSRGRTPDGGEVNLPQQRELLAEAFDSDVGIENPTINIGATGFLFYEVTDIIPARDRTLDEVRDQVVADWRDDEAATRLAQKAEALRKELADGRPFAEIAEELGLELKTRRGLKRDSEDLDLDRSGVAAVFGVARGETGLVRGGTEGSQILFKVTEVFEPASAGPDTVAEQTRESLTQGLSDDLLDLLVAELQSKYEVRINQGAINQALSF